MQTLSKEVIENPERYPQWTDVMPDYRQVQCPNTERIQSNLIQMKLNLYDLDEGQKLADMLAKAIKYFS